LTLEVAKFTVGCKRNDGSSTKTRDVRHIVVGLGQTKGILVAITNEAGFGTGTKHLRAGVRLNSRVPVGVEWTEGGETRKAEGYTVDISPKGCMAIVTQGFAVGQKMRLTNLVNGRSVDARLVWRVHEGRTGWELGLELDNSTMEFWEVEF
jgi:hypothetical protein